MVNLQDEEWLTFAKLAPLLKVSVPTVRVYMYRLELVKFGHIANTVGIRGNYLVFKKTDIPEINVIIRKLMERKWHNGRKFKIA